MSTLETLPDEILMIIIRYSGDAHSLFRTYSGLNQRFSSILIDRRLHLFSELLYTTVDDRCLQYYFNSNAFQQTRHQFVSLKASKDDKQLQECIRSLIISYIQAKYAQLGQEFQSNIKHFQFIRANLIDEEKNTLDQELAHAFKHLPIDVCVHDFYCSWNPYFSPESISHIKQIEPRILRQGASLQCNESDGEGLNFTMALNKWLLAKASLTEAEDRYLVDPLLQLFKTSLVSNPVLLKNRGFTRYNTSERCVHYFLIHSIYHLNYFHDSNPVVRKPMKMYWYGALLDLLLFVIHCVNYIHDEQVCLEELFSDILSMIKSSEPSTPDEIFIYTTQLAILRIILHESERTNRTLNHTHVNLYNLFKNDQLDLIRLLYSESEQVRNLCHQTKITENIVKIMIASRKKIQLLSTLLDDPLFKSWLTSSNVLFIYLRKKQCKIIRHLLRLFPCLINQLDEHGNNPLLYVAVKVRGCRHRLVEFLIQMGCNVHRKNTKGESFVDALKLPCNRTLMNKLIEHEILEIEDSLTSINVNGEYC
ncbi:unnamed protein product [Adineta ricciae]|uniref:Uncharacterized protein n=1 Tax=Adineta ricciae TaxID=249248 RepID=A0A814ZAN7_ADIRI|nr:unnamed protein product [Adineta ricciae]